MILVGLTAAALALTLYDALFTQRRMEKYGWGVELNPLIQWLGRHSTSLVRVIANGIVIPSILLIAGMDILELDHVLAFYVGLRAWLSISQLRSLAFEADVDKSLREIAAAKSVPPPTPPDA